MDNKKTNFHIRTKDKERSYSAILPHYSSESSSQAKRLAPNHQKKKNPEIGSSVLAEIPTGEPGLLGRPTRNWG